MTIELNKIYAEDCIETLNRMEDNFLDLTVTSPPYNVDLGNNKFNKDSYSLYRDNKDHHIYIKDLEKVFKLIYKKTKSGGRCCINIADGKNGKIPTHADIIQFMTQMGWIVFTTIIWEKNQVGNRTSWGSFNSPSCPSFPTPFEFILIFCKEDKKLQWKGETDLEKEDFIKWSLAKWVFAPESKKRIGHPAPFPEELPKRCIKMLSWKDSIVYDPYMGSGTTAVVCKKNNRNFIGSEIDKSYVELANKRICNL